MGKHRTTREYREALTQAHGYVSQAAITLDLTVQAVRKRIRNNQGLKKLVDDLRASRTTNRLDMAEHKLDGALRDGKTWAIRYVLDKQGHERGFVDKVHVFEEEPPSMPKPLNMDPEDWADTANTYKRRLTEGQKAEDES